jgi:hypothetical protein
MSGKSRLAAVSSNLILLVLMRIGYHLLSQFRYKDSYYMGICKTNWHFSFKNVLFFLYAAVSPQKSLAGTATHRLQGYPLPSLALEREKGGWLEVWISCS